MVEKWKHDLESIRKELKEIKEFIGYPTSGKIHPVSIMTPRKMLIALLVCLIFAIVTLLFFPLSPTGPFFFNPYLNLE